MALPNISKIHQGELAAVPNDPDPHGYADSVRQVLDVLPAVRDALQITPDRMRRIRFDGEWGLDDDDNPVGKVIIPIGRRDAEAAAALRLYIWNNTTDLEFDGVLFSVDR